MKLTLLRKRETLRNIERVFQLTFVAADNYVTGGVVLDFTKAVIATPAARANIPSFVEALPVAGISAPANAPPPSSAFSVTQVPVGTDAEVVQNPVAPTLKNYLFKIASGNAELAQAGMPAGITGDANGFTFSCVTAKKYG